MKIDREEAAEALGVTLEALADLVALGRLAQDVDGMFDAAQVDDLRRARTAALGDMAAMDAALGLVQLR
jgi:hypothetical protein